MITVKTALIPKGKLIQVMADTEAIESHQLEADEKAKVIIEVEKVIEKKPGEE